MPGDQDGAEPIKFGYLGADYEMDLCPSDTRRLRGLLAELATHGRRVTPPRQRGRSRPQAGRDRDAAIRAYARQQGIKVADKGRLPAAALTAWRAR
jgi:hypothetical protein